MLILLGIALATLVVPLLGGRLAGLGTLDLRGSRFVVGALVVQVLALAVFPTWPHALLAVLHGLSYVLAAAFAWANRHVAGLPLLAVGGGLNALAIAANGGVMPASETAVRAAGLPVEVDEFVNSRVLDDPRLALLGDVLATPAWLPMRNAYSLGDLLLLLGAVWVVHAACGTVLVRDPRTWLRGARTG